MRIGTGVLVTVLAVSTAHALDVDLEAYRGARRAGALGVVTGRIYAESRIPNGQPRPITPATVTLAPRSAALEGRLRQLKDESRESADGFTSAAPSMRQAKERYERELLEAGAPELAVLVAVDAEGRFRIPDVPAGSWLVLAWHSSPVDVSAPKGKPKERSLYQPRTRLQGFQSVTVWFQEVTVTGGGTVTLDLTDRNGWFRGVAEERVRDTGR